MKKALRFLILFLVGIIMVLGIVGCNGKPNKEIPTGPFYSLQWAYDQRWLTKENLQEIASYQSSSMQYPESLNDETAKLIKKDFAKKQADRFPEKEITEEMVDIWKYYGTYGDCVVVKLDLAGTIYPDIVYPDNTIEIGGATFYIGPGPSIVVWKNENI